MVNWKSLVKVKYAYDTEVKEWSVECDALLVREIYSIHSRIKKDGTRPSDKIKNLLFDKAVFDGLTPKSIDKIFFEVYDDDKPKQMFVGSIILDVEDSSYIIFGINTY